MDYQEWFKTMQQYLKDPSDVQKQLDSLKQVQNWLEINTNMVKNTIQYLEFYKNIYSNFSNNTNYNPPNLDFSLMSNEWLAQMQKLQDLWTFNKNNSNKE